MAESKIGILAESENDCQVMETLVHRILEERGISPQHYKILHRAGNGKNGLRAHCERWMRELAARECRNIILMQDRDRANEARLRDVLQAYAVPRDVRRHVCIPVEELEAWFFSCDKALQLICGEGVSSHETPHSINDPKGKLIALSQNKPGRSRYSPNDGVRIAKVLDLDVCARRCPAFHKVRSFVQGIPSS